MNTARAWKLGVGLATLMLIALMAAVLVARATVGYSDWPSASDPPAAEETVVASEPQSPASEPASMPVATPVSAEPETTSAAVPVKEVASAEEESVLTADEPRTADEPEVEETTPTPAEVAPDAPVASATDSEPAPEREVSQLARPDAGGDGADAEATTEADDGAEAPAEPEAGEVPANSPLD